MDYTGKDIFLGIDSHKKSWNVTVRMGTFEQTFNAPPKAKELRTFLDRDFPGGNYYSAYEAGFAGFWPHFQLLDHGINSIVVNAADIPTTVKEKIQKNDSRDSKKIARALQNNELTAIYIPSKKCLIDRTLNRYRTTVSRDMARTKNRIKSLLALNGIDIPSEFSERGWSTKMITWLKEIELDATLRLTLNGHLDELERLQLKKRHVTKLIREMSKTPEYSQDIALLTSIPGIGLVTAMTIRTELEDIKRFKSFDQLCSFIGLIPSTRSSGENEKVGEMTPRTQTFLLPAIIEAAWIAVRKDPALASKYAELCSKGKKPQKAIVIIARKLVRRMNSVLKKRIPYECGIA